MTERDRAWRRRKTRILSQREEIGDRSLSEAKVKPLADFKQHQPGKLTAVQSMRQDWHLRDDAEDAFVTEPVIDPTNPL